MDHIKINDTRLKVDIEITDQKLDFGFSKPSSSTINDEIKFDKLDLKSENILNDMVSSVQELRNNAYVIIPTSLIAGYYVDCIIDKNTNENKSLKNQALQKVIPAIMSSILPLESKLIFNATKNGKAAYDKYVNQVLEHADELTRIERASALSFAIPPALGGIADTVARVVSPQYSIDALGYSYVKDSAIELIGENYASFAVNAINMGIKFIANGLIVQPAVKAIKAGLNGGDESSKNKTFIERVGEGLTRGVEQSFFGKLFKADFLINQNSVLELAALRWQKVLNQKPELVSDIDAQRELYDKMVQKGNESAIKSGVLERDILPYPSFDSVKLYLKNEKDKNFIDETLPLYVGSKNPSSSKGK